NINSKLRVTSEDNFSFRGCISKKKTKHNSLQLMHCNVLRSHSTCTCRPCNAHVIPCNCSIPAPLGYKRPISVHTNGSFRWFRPKKGGLSM
ncbi:hypothetical protein GIB67_017169, partial [Kingdonia uniflora]